MAQSPVPISIAADFTNNSSTVLDRAVLTSCILCSKLWPLFFTNCHTNKHYLPLPTGGATATRAPLHVAFQVSFGARSHTEQLHRKSSFMMVSSDPRETMSSAARVCYLFSNRQAGVLRRSQSGCCDKKRKRKKNQELANRLNSRKKKIQ